MEFPRSRSIVPLYPKGAVRGLTLIEVLIVVALMALLAGTIVLGSGALIGSRQRGAATLILAGIRLGMTQANVTGYPVRMVFDLDKQQVLLEEASGQVVREKVDKKQSKSDRARAEAEEKARQQTDRVLKGINIPRPTYTPVKKFGEDGKGRDLGAGVKFRQVQTEHDPEPITSGRAYLYFWPRGGTERAVVQLSTGSGEGLSVVVSALTGRAKLQRGAVDLPETRGDDEYSEREEE